MGQANGYFRGVRPEMLVFLPQRYTRVLEVGCGEGGFLAHNASAIEYWGIEPNTEAAERAASRLYKVFNGRYDAVVDELPDDYFDLIVCNDVIEHMPDHDAFLQSIRRKLKTDGFLIGSIPNVRHYALLTQLLFRKDWQYVDAGLLDRTHLRFFTEKSWRRVIAENGFQLEAMHGLNACRSRLFPLRAGFRTIILAFLQLVTFGKTADLRYLQFGFRARRS